MKRPEPLEVGAEFERSVVVSPEMVRGFAELTGDRNPLHLDDAEAIAAGFEGAIVHGMLMGALVSAFLTEEVTGPGGAYVAQSLQFRAPARVGSRIILRLRVIALEPMDQRATIRTTVRDEGGTTLVAGEAIMRLPAAESSRRP